MDPHRHHGFISRSIIRHPSPPPRFLVSVMDVIDSAKAQRIAQMIRLLPSSWGICKGKSP